MVSARPRAQLYTGGLGPAVLPDDGMVNGLAGLAVPYDSGFTLVGDAYSLHLGRSDAGLGQRLARRGELDAPDFQGIVLHPARLGVDLGQFLLRHRHGVATGVEHDAAGAGGALVEGKQVGHGNGVSKSGECDIQPHLGISQQCGERVGWCSIGEQAVDLR